MVGKLRIEVLPGTTFFDNNMSETVLKERNENPSFATRIPLP